MNDDTLLKTPQIPRYRCFFETAALIANPINVLKQHTDQSGTTFRYYFGGAQKVLVSSDPAIIRHVLKDNHSNYDKSPIQTKHMVNYLGKGLLSDEWKAWRPKRRVMQKGFYVGHLDQQAQLMQQALEQSLPSFENDIRNGTIDLSPALCRFVFTMTARALFGVSMSQAEIDQISTTVSTVQRFMVRQVFQPYLNPWFHLSGQVARHQRIRHAGDQILLKHIKKRLQHPTHEGDVNLLDIMLSLLETDASIPLSLPEVLAETMQFLVAGHETSSNALTWIFTLLGQHPEYIEQMLTEWHETVADRAVLFSDLPHLPKTNAIINEALRLYPPFWMLDRVALDDDTINGIHIRKGDSIMNFIYGLHRDTTLWDQPERFYPERFTDARQQQKDLIHIPFGAGPRRCIGEQFARVQLILILQTLLQRYDVDFVNPTVELMPNFTLSRKGGLPVNVSIK